MYKRVQLGLKFTEWDLARTDGDRVGNHGFRGMNRISGGCSTSSLSDLRNGRLEIYSATCIVSVSRTEISDLEGHVKLMRAS